MIGFRSLQLISLTLASLLQALDCSPMLFQQQEEEQEQQQQPMGLPLQSLQQQTQQSLVAPILTRHGNEDDSYIVLTEDELTQNADMLRHLSLATKEEVEEIVEGNPAIQQALLKKIKKVVKLREEANHLLEDGKAMKHYYDHVHINEPVVVDKVKHMHFEKNIKYPPKPKVIDKAKHVHIEENREDYIEDLEDDLEHQLAAERMKLIKLQLKSNAAKLFRIGSSIRRKIKEMRKQKALAKEKIPKFHVNVSTSKYKESPPPAIIEE